MRNWNLEKEVRFLNLEHSIQPTYEELKHTFTVSTVVSEPGIQPTYEELKLFYCFAFYRFG